MITCANCSRSFDGDKCPYCGSVPQLILHDSPVQDTGPWWARPTEFGGWEFRLSLFGTACGAIIWTVKKLGPRLSIILGIPALGVAAYMIWLRYRDDEL
jgi:hypothetical protein